MVSEKQNNPAHPALAFAIRNGVLHAGGCDIRSLAQRAGPGGFYLYDAGLVRERLAALRQAMPADARLSYALKANPFAPLLRLMSRLVDGFDVASSGEMAAAITTGMAASAISFAGPGKDAREIAAALSAGVRLVVEDVGEIDDIARLSRELPLTRAPRLALRIHPPFALKRAGMRMGGEATAFGISVDEIEAVVKRARDAGIEIDGLHVFAASQSLDGSALGELHERTAELMITVAETHGLRPRWLNLGGGYGIPYAEGDRPLDLAAVMAGLARACDRLRGHWPDAEILIELGRYLVGEAGLYVMRVLRRKRINGETFLVTDGGLHQHLAATGNFGQVLHRAWPICLPEHLPEGIARSRGEPDRGEERVWIAGRLCTPLDVFARRIILPRVVAGDLIAVCQSGAYGASASPNRFLSHPPPVEMLVG